MWSTSANTGICSGSGAAFCKPCVTHHLFQEYNQYVRSNVHGLFQTIVTQGNQHQVNPNLG